MVLNRNPENFFAETEQVAFHLGNLVPGIDVSDDPLLQGRLFSYLDTQLIRLGGPNFAQLPINQARAAVHHNQRDGYHQMRIDRGRVSYSPNSLQGGYPMQADGAGYQSYPTPVAGAKVRQRSDSFSDHFSQATLFWNSMSPVEQEHIVAAYRFELGKVKTLHIRERMVDLLTNVDQRLATLVADGIGVVPPSGGGQRATRAALARLREGWAQYGTTGLPGRPRPLEIETSPALSQMSSPHDSAKGRRVAILASDGVDAGAVGRIIRELVKQNALGEVVSLRQGPLVPTNGADVVAEHTVLTMPSVAYDGICVVGGPDSIAALATDLEVLRYLSETWKHEKPIAADAAALPLLEAAGIRVDLAGPDAGLLIAHSSA